MSKLYLIDKICICWLFRICYMYKKKKARFMWRPSCYYQAIKWHLATTKCLQTFSASSQYPRFLWINCLTKTFDKHI